MHNYLPLSTLSWIIAILIAFYGSHVNDVTRLPGANKSQATRRDVVKFSPCPYPDKDITICFANERPISLIHTVAQSIPSRFQVSPFHRVLSAKLIFQNFSWLTRSKGWWRAEGREKIGLTPARESFYGASFEPNRISKSTNTLDIRKAARQSLRRSRCARFRNRSRVTWIPPSNG